MKHASLSPTTLLALGIADINSRQPVKKENVRDAAQGLMETLSGDEISSAVDAMDVEIDRVDVQWSIESDVAEFRDTILEARSLLYRSLKLRFDGVDMLVARVNPDGWSAGAADMVMQRTWPDGTIFRSSEVWTRVRHGLAAALNAADDWIRHDLYGTGNRDRLLEEHEPKPKRTAPEQEMPPHMLFTLGEFLETNPSSDIVDIQRHLRAQLNAHLAEWSGQAKRALLESRTAFLKQFGVDESLDTRRARRKRLEEALEKRDMSERLDRLMISSVPETVLEALTQGFQAASPGATTADLMGHLRTGMERLRDIHERLDGLGNASRYGYVKTADFLELADFDAAATVIEEVRALAQKLAAKGTPFLPPAPPRRTRRHLYGVDLRGFKMVEPEVDDLLPRDSFLKQGVYAAALNGPPVRYARAAAKLGNHLARDRQQITRMQFRERLQLSIGWWEAATAWWTRPDYPRKWGVLSCNMANARAKLSMLRNEPSGLAPALAEMQSARDVLEEAGEAWCYAAAHSAFLRIRSDMIRHGIEALPAGTGHEAIPKSDQTGPGCTASPTLVPPCFKGRPV
ncbi:hypothetical protein [Amaricoccus tamworthensis]|uniref:hypothetical protein n=1 Tax=Amaricoccus tamworthensis TaxID=57002 RepID=UPI003C7D3B07